MTRLRTWMVAALCAALFTALPPGVVVARGQQKPEGGEPTPGESRGGKPFPGSPAGSPAVIQVDAAVSKLGKP